jgi:2-amino-4-hydroxy-6-hydroxymethyldihydropteridine diphosphokinase
MAAHLAFIGAGSNLDNPIAHVRQALDELDGVERSRCVTRSSLYLSPPMGPKDQPDYVNAVASMETWLTPLGLLEALLEIERRHGRIRDDLRWGPRTLDLDLLLYDEDMIQHERLTVPHPGLHERAFVLYPLREIVPELHVPGRGALEALLAECPRGALRRIDS